MTASGPDFESFSPEARAGGAPLEAGDSPSDHHLELDLDDSELHCDLLIEPDPVQLERRGVTRQRKPSHQVSEKHLWQGNLFESGRLFKDSIVAKLYSIGHGDIAEKLGYCHSQKLRLTCNGCQKVVTVFNRCDQFYCPCCTPRLANERREAVEWWVKEVGQPKHVVLTKRNSMVLTDKEVEAIKKEWNRLRRSKFAKKKTFWWWDPEKELIKPIKHWKPPIGEARTITSQPWRGGFYSLEVTNEKRGWHLHIHALVDADYIDCRILSYMWNKVTKGEGYIVKVKDCRGKGYLQEVTKYAVKGSELAGWSPKDIVSFIEAFKGKRTFGVFGSLYGKRTQWAEFIAKMKDKRGRCACGCNEFTVRSQNEWEMATAMLMPEPMKGLPPPPAGCTVSTRQLILHLIPSA